MLHVLPTAGVLPVYVTAHQLADCVRDPAAARALVEAYDPTREVVLLVADGDLMDRGSRCVRVGPLDVVPLPAAHTLRHAVTHYGQRFNAEVLAE